MPEFLESGKDDLAKQLKRRVRTIKIKVDFCWLTTAAHSVNQLYT